MSTENETIVEVQEDLDLFSADFFGQNEAEPAPASAEVEEKPDEDAPPEDTHGDEAEDLENDDTDEDDDQIEESAPAEPPKKKNRFQERIDEVVGKQRETERQLTAALAQLEQLQKNKEPEPAPKPVVKEYTGPNVDDVLEDGTDKYPLGEFDPNYIRDLTRHALQEEREEMRKQDEIAAAQKEQDAQRAELHASWNEKLGPAKERYPDLVDRGAPFLEDLGSKIDSAYGEYLTTVLMGLDNGPDVLNYLINNPDDAVKLVNSGYTRATLTLGAIDAKFAEAEQEKKLAKPIVSKAPTPPAHVNKGAAVSVAEVPDDTDDLDAFTTKLFPGRKKA